MKAAASLLLIAASCLLLWLIPAPPSPRHFFITALPWLQEPPR